MFQPWFVELLSVVSNILVGISAIVVAVVGLVGIRQWRAELKGRTKFELARRMAKLAYQYRDKYKAARNPFTFKGESVDRQKGDNETADETNLLDEYHARRKRLQPLQETLRELYEASWEAEVLLDQEISNLIQPLETAFKELFASIEAYFHANHEKVGRNVVSNQQEEWLVPHYKRIYGFEDDVNKTVDDAVIVLVEKLKKYVM